MKIFNFIVSVLILLVLIGCQEEVQRQIQSVEVSINDSNKLSISDSIYFISSYSSPNRITIISDVPNVNFNFSVNGGQFMKSMEASLIFQNQDSIFQYYLTKEGFDNSAIKTIVFPKHSKRFLDKIVLNPTSLDSTFKINLYDKSRGVIKLEIFTITGSKILERSHGKNTDNLSIHYALENYPPGIYLVGLSYGKDLKLYRMLRK